MLEFIENIAKKAGDILMFYYDKLKPEDFKQKGNSGRDFATRADIESEKFIVSAITEKFPEHSIYAEEESAIVKNERFWWFIDPLDGTVNYAQRFPFFAVSIGFYIDAKPEFAVVYAPKLGEIFTAQKGKGCYFNGQKTRVSTKKNLKQAILSSGFSYKRNELKENNNFGIFTELGLACAGIRRPGSAAIDLAYVADGRFDGFWEYYLSPWDVAAGALLIQEAGGIVTDYKGSSASRDFLFGNSIAAGNPEIHSQMLPFLKPPDSKYPDVYFLPEGFIL